MIKKNVREFRPLKVPNPGLPPLGSFGSVRPLDLEIGCGVGFHPIRYAQTHPDRDLVAIEHTAIKFEKFKRRLENHPQIQNVLPVHGNAISWVTHQARPELFERVFLLYPNPNHFWYKHPFMHQLVLVMKKGGLFELRTNLKDYADEAIEYLSEAFNLTLEQNITLTLQETNAPVSHFEKKYLERGEPCYLQRWRKP